MVRHQATLEWRRRARGACRTRVARIHLALLEYCYALEGGDPERARTCRTGARAVGWMCALVGDEATLDFRTASAHARMRTDMREVAAIAAAGGDPEPALIATLDAYLGDVRGSLLPARREVLPAASARAGAEPAATGLTPR